MLVSIATIIAFVGVWRIKRPLDPVEARVREYGADLAVPGSPEYVGAGTLLSRVNRAFSRLSLGARLAEELAQADLPLTAAEFAMLVVGAAIAGFLLGAWRVGPVLGLALGALFAYVPILHIRREKKRRQNAFTEQLPDVLTLTVGALRAGYGLSQALQVLVDQLPQPAAKEFARVMRGVALGVPMQRALHDMAERINTDDVQLVVTAISVQHEMGGNLAETLDTIGETVGDRLRIQREIRVLTSEERLTGNILAALPALLGVVMYTLNPRFMSQLLAPGWVRVLPVVAVLMQIAGFLVMRRIADIEV